MPDHESSFACMSLEQFQSRMAHHHQRVCCDKGRVEIREGDNTCVLISKVELDALEKALEILSNTAEVQNMARTIAMLTRSAAEAPLLATARSESH